MAWSARRRSPELRSRPAQLRESPAGTSRTGGPVAGLDLNGHRPACDTGPVTEQAGPPRATNGPGADAPAESSLTRLVAPVFAGFSLPAIVTLIAARFPGPPWRQIALSLLIASTGLFMGSLQLSIGRLQQRYD